MNETRSRLLLNSSIIKTNTKQGLTCLIRIINVEIFMWRLQHHLKLKKKPKS